MPTILTLALVSVGAFVTTMAGGLIALRAVRAVGIVIALGAGIRIGAAFFDLLPESVEHLGGSVNVAMLFGALGFLAFYVLEKVTLLHIGHETATEIDHEDRAHQHVGLIGAGGMSLHSLLDGVAVGAALQAGTEVGLIVAVVVVIHRFSDGIGIVSLLLASRFDRGRTFRWLAYVAVTPLVGAVLASVVPVPDAALGAMLAIFAGFFLYIGAAELLPEAHRTDRSYWVIGATLAGAAGIVLVSQALGSAHL